MCVVHLVGRVGNPQGVLGHLCKVCLQHRPDADVHELGVTEETIVVRGVTVTIRKPPAYAGHVWAQPPKGRHQPPPSGGVGEGVRVVKLVGVAEHEGGQHVYPKGQNARTPRLHWTRKAMCRGVASPRDGPQRRYGGN